MSERGVVIHVPGSSLESDGEGLAPFYAKLAAGFDALSVPYRIEAFDKERGLERVEKDDWFHLFNHGRVQHTRALNCGVAYVYPFWHCDPNGIRSQSTIGARKFRAFKVDEDKAKAFLARLRRRWLERRDSRYDQPQEVTELPPNTVAVFFQSEHERVHEVCYMDRWQMLETVLETHDGPVLVKPHPRDFDASVGDQLEDLQAQYPQLIVSKGNIHDILAQCVRVVTINSAVGIEAYLHRKPVVLCGAADFHHIADVARSPVELAEFVEAEARGRVYAKYLYWYFVMQCVDAGRPEKAVAKQVLRKIAATGFDFDGAAEQAAG